MGRPAVFLDRDGVLNENRDQYVRSWEEFSFLPGTFAALRGLNTLDLPVVVITNQAGVGRGLIPEERIDEIHQRMAAEIARQGARIEQIYWCPHTTQDDCDCRKPKPGLLLRAAEQLGIDLAASVFVGDAETDVEAGKRAGCRTVLVLTGRGRDAVRKMAGRSDRKTVPDAIAADLEAALPYLKQILPSKPAREFWWPDWSQLQSAFSADGLSSPVLQVGKG
ncbi:MAG TPA: D-glycero-beta-D-manno-heptose 1,7-bisphosphate 7-phosphatase [Thermomicrobiales bacterium]|nr:D-glycero-beta-D-manno-heptose 1,7-bisphosphate 7-phosphatase [Thermomicrobiales bacterium]